MAQARDYRLEAVRGVIEGLAPGLALAHAGDAGRRISALQRSDRGHVSNLDRFGTGRARERVAKGAPGPANCGLPQPGQQHRGALPGGRPSGSGNRAAEVTVFYPKKKSTSLVAPELPLLVGPALRKSNWLCDRLKMLFFMSGGLASAPVAPVSNRRAA